MFDMTSRKAYFCNVVVHLAYPYIPSLIFKIYLTRQLIFGSPYKAAKQNKSGNSRSEQQRFPTKDLKYEKLPFQVFACLQLYGCDILPFSVVIVLMAKCIGRLLLKDQVPDKFPSNFQKSCYK